ncbi:MAG: PilT/PilU family type 4a pilus ATPase [Chloroflexi bacterium]|nr:MAG: PilT/PilU family type 4a pilus ATPase [Chloroflexota bacterium]TMD51915.1 MAG: PilT/PilU family type 4a pilus ATPase [Chloroflexota bacterium]
MPLNAFVDVGTVDLAHALDQLLELGGSDLLISCGSAPRIRRDGVLRPMDETMAPLTVADTHRLIHEALSESQFAELATNRSVDFAFTWRETVRVRGNAYYQRGSLAAAFRLLPMRIPSFHELGIPQSVIDLIGRRQGLVLVTGPTGSGKSTTLAALVDHINHSRECHVVTIEDPIEYVHRHITAVVDQRQVGTDTGSFADALRSVFREDPDVILIGEMRDLETISSALTLAETGHLVLATLHTNDASQAIDRVLDGFEASQQQQVRIQLGACLTGIVYQQLLPAVGGGRIAAFEVLVANSAIRALIKEGKTNQIRNALQTSLRDGSQTLERSLTQLIKSGLVTDHEARGRSLHAQEIG